MSNDAVQPARPRPLIRDPRLIPVIGTDRHLPAVPTAHLQADWLRERLAQAHVQTPALPGDGGRQGLGQGEPLRPASVLVPLVSRTDGLQVLLTRRTDHLHDHAGQISFPGGRRDPDDADAVATALREAQEEVGLAPHQVEVFAQLPDYQTITRYQVTPVMALVDPHHELLLDAFEVAEAFEVPLAFLMDPAHHRRHQVDLGDGLCRQFLSMPWSPDPVARPEAYFIWGATAAMLRNLYHLLADAPPGPP